MKHELPRFEIGQEVAGPYGMTGFIQDILEDGKVIVVNTIAGEYKENPYLWEPLITCSICGKKIHPTFSNNADPVNKGRCCSICNRSIVIPARIADL